MKIRIVCINYYLKWLTAFVTDRMNTYKQLTLVLDQLYNLSLSPPGLSITPNSSFGQDQNSFKSKEVKTEVSKFPMEFCVEWHLFLFTTGFSFSFWQGKRLLQLILESNDELLHIAVYEWMLNKELYGELISITNPSLENYLTRTVERNPNQIQISDLLWKYYEKNLNHAAAAKILHKLAVRKG